MDYAGLRQMLSVFILWHVHEHPDAADDEKLIGVYSSRADAEGARSRVSDKTGFAEHPEGFLIEEYVLGKDHWTEGFG